MIVKETPQAFRMRILHEQLIYLKYCALLNYEIDPDEIHELELKVYPELSDLSKVGEYTLGLRELDELLLLFFIADPHTDEFSDSIKARIIKLEDASIRMRAEKNHNLPHFHIEYKQEYCASYAIDTLERLAGYMPKTHEKDLLKWASQHQDDLRKIWSDLKSGKDISEFLLEAHQSKK